jgi:thiosulfate/3-mercaptopyruvate sulfurtransferase
MAGSTYAAPELLADTSWLAEHLDDSSVRVVDTDLPDGYRKAHIPGAVGVPYHYLKGDDQPLHVMGPDAFKALMELLGIGGDTLVVAYDSNRGLTAARLWWALGYYGHANVRVLNGGWRKWVQEGRAIQTGSAKVAARSVTFEPRARRGMLATLEDLTSAHDRPDVAVWDVRSDGEYTGEVDRGNSRSGHLPGAHHLEWLKLVNERDHTFRDAGEMRALLEGAGITPEKTVYTH